jgi:hypothetical protein
LWILGRNDLGGTAFLIFTWFPAIALRGLFTVHLVGSCCAMGQHLAGNRASRAPLAAAGLAAAAKRRRDSQVPP